MATRNLKGLTIEIGGNTSNLTDSLKDVDGELSSLQANLRTVESALRLDPGNVDALAERQRLLNKAVETTSDRLEILREAQRQADEQIANGVPVDERLYNNLRAEIIRAEASLNNYTTQVNDAEEQSRALADTSETVITETEKLSNEIDAQAEALKDLKAEYTEAVLKYGETSDEANDLANQIETLSGELETNRDRMSAAQYAARNLGDEEEEVLSETEKLSRAIGEQEDDLKKLKDEYVEAVLKYGETSEEAQNLAERLEEVSDELRVNRDRMSDAETAASEFAGELDDGADDAAEGWTIVGDVIADLASESIQAAIDAFKDLLLEGEKAMDLLQAKTGASADEIAKYEGVAKDVFSRGWGESITDVTDAIGTVTQIMGDLDDVELTKVTENAMTLSDVFGWDVSESIRTVNSMMDQFGITSDVAFNLLAQGAQNGLDQNGDLLDTINEYSVQFADAGFSAKNMFNMLANGADAGTWSIDKLGDAFKEYNIRVSDGTVSEALMNNRKKLGLTRKEVDALSDAYAAGGKEGKKAMKQTLDAVLAVEDETERYNLGVELFGTMWEDLGEDAVAALFETEGAIKSTNGAMEDVKTDAYDNLATSLTALGRTLIDELVTPLVDKVSPVIKSIVNWAIENIDVLKPIIIGVAVAVGVLAGALAISGIITSVQKAFALLNSTLLANPIVLIVAALAGLVAAFIYLWKNCEEFRTFWIDLWNNIVEIVSPIIESIKGFFVSAWTTIKETWNTVQPYFALLWENIKLVFATVVETLSGFFTAAWDAIVLVWDLVVEYFSTVWENIKLVFATVVEVLAGYFSLAWDNIKIVWDLVVEYFTTLWESIKLVFSVVSDVLSGNWSDAWTAIQGIIDLWAEYFQGVWDSIAAIFEGVGEWFESTFNSAWELVQGVFANWGEFFSGLWDTISTTFSELGTSIGDAIGESVKAGINGILSWVESTVNGAIDLINGAIDIINKVPGVDVPKLSEVEIPRLAGGHVAREPMIAEIGEYTGASRNPEIVTPQDILRDTFEGTLAKFAQQGMGAGEDEFRQLTTQLAELRALVGEFLPEIAAKSKKSIYLDKQRLVGELAPDMDDALGEIADRKAVGAV